jgi:homoserine kinase
VNRSVKAFAPATVANATSGFDIFGFALEEPGDTVICSLSDQPGLRIAPLEGAYSELPTDPDKNTAGVAIQALMQKYDIHQGLDLVIKKGVPIVGGMGSSASSAAAAVAAVNELLELNLSALDLLPFVIASEKMATGSPHADNAAPCLLGGFSLVRCIEPLDVVSVSVPENLSCAIVHPHMQIKTKDARGILPENVSMKTATRQMGHAAGFVLGLANNDLDLISRSMVDELAEPHRSKLIPGYAEVKEAALKSGALGCGISGSGPSMFALCPSLRIAQEVGQAMTNTFQNGGMGSDLYISRISQQGARILDVDA